MWAGQGLHVNARLYHQSQTPKPRTHPLEAKCYLYIVYGVYFILRHGSKVDIGREMACNKLISVILMGFEKGTRNRKYFDPKQLTLLPVWMCELVSI